MTRSRNRVTAVALALLLVVSGVGGVAHASTTGASATASTNAPPADSYVIEQGGECLPIEALSSNGTVESFYDYRNHETHPDADSEDRQYSSYGTTHLQEDNSSILFLHEGTDGLSLVTVHGHVDDDSEGGVASFDIVGLPSEAEWVVQDDLYDGPSNMAEWGEGDGWASADWIWREARTDGGAINGGLNDEFAVTIHPAFNEDATHYDNEDLHDPEFFEDGEVDDWEFLSGDADDPDRTDLSLDEPVTIRTGTCDGPSVTYDRTGDGDEDGMMATIDGASIDDRIPLQPTSGTAENVSVESVELTGVDETGAIAFENDQPDGVASSPDGVESLSHLAMSGDSLGDASATVTVSVAASELTEHGLDPEDVALYEADGGEWHQVATSVSDESGSAVQFTAEVSSFEGLTIAEQQEELTSGESGADESGGDDDSSSMPGFAIGAAVAALLLAVLWSVRGRER